MSAITAVLVGDKAVLARLNAMPPAVHNSLLRRITRLSIELQSHIKQDKLSGQVLRRRTGTLSRSIARKITDTPTGIEGTVGTNLAYGHAHEYGFKGTVNVRASMRLIKQAFGRPITPIEVAVRPYAMKMNLPERSFLRSALRDMETQIRAEMAAALTEAVKK